jgi:hypothetical protein
MIERYAIRDARGRVTAHVLKETPHHGAFFRSGSRPPEPESPLVDTICMVAGFIMLAATVALVWIMATAA